MNSRLLVSVIALAALGCEGVIVDRPFGKQRRSTYPVAGRDDVRGVLTGEVRHVKEGEYYLLQGEVWQARGDIPGNYSIAVCQKA